MSSILDRMQFYALDANFDIHDVIDVFTSVIWTERFSDPGDFEVHGGNVAQLRKIINEASYIFNTANSKLMVIEEPDVGYNEDDGDTITISGRSITSVLDRRLILSQLTLFNPTDRRISQIICDMVSSAFGPGDAARYWDMLEVVNETGEDSVALGVNVGMEFTLGENVLDIAVELAQAFNLGLKCVYDKVNKKIKFVVYEGADHSQQGENLVTFSDLYDNLATAREAIRHQEKKDTILVVGTAEDAITELPWLPQLVTGGATGLDRRETFFKADQDPVIYNSNGTQTDMTPTQYAAALIQAGTKEILRPAYRPIRDYDGSIIENEKCTYGEHFELGDLVKFSMPHGTSTTARLTAVTFSIDSKNGSTFIPRFDFV